jgi:uncharacterized metal-binding protein YceD (DUF177 family)
MPDLVIASGLHQKHFSVEEVYHDEPMGYHLRDGIGHLPPNVWKNKDQRANILKYCPDVKIILPMKLERERCEGDNREGHIDPNVAIQREKAEAEERARKAKEIAEKKAAEENKKKEEEEAKKIAEGGLGR